MTWRCPGCHQEVAILPRGVTDVDAIVVDHWKPNPPYRTWIRPLDAPAERQKPIDAWLRCEWSGARVEIHHRWNETDVAR